MNEKISPISLPNQFDYPLILMCRQDFQGETSIHVHHITRRCNGGGDALSNRVMLHPNCHHQVHYLMKLDADTSFVSAHTRLVLDNGASKSEVKVTSTVLRGLPHREVGRLLDDLII